MGSVTFVSVDAHIYEVAVFGYGARQKAGFQGVAQGGLLA